MAEASTRMTWGQLLRAMGVWLKENLPRALLMSAASFAFGWLVNFWVMAFRWDGFRAPMGESDYIAAENSLVSGSLFWMALASFLLAVVSYGYRVGWGQLFEEITSLPGRIATMFRGEERNRSLTSLMWALMLGLLLSLVISPGVGAIVAGFFVFFAATPLGDLLTGVLRRLWIQLVARFAPHKGEPSSEVGSAAVTAAGMAVGFLIAVAVDNIYLKVLALLMAGLAAYFFANEEELGPSGGTAVLLLMVAAVGLHELFEVGVAFADDGGWSECGDCNIFDYATSTGATEVVSRSTVAGGGAAVGAPVGAAVGDVLGTVGGGGGGGGVGPGGGGGSAPAPSAGTGPGEPVRVTGGGGGDTGTTPTHSDADATGTTPTDSAPDATDDGGGEAGAETTSEESGAEVRTAADEDIAPAPDAEADDGDILGAIGGGEGGGAAAGAEPTGDAGGPSDDTTAEPLTRPSRRQSGEEGSLDQEAPEQDGQAGDTAPPPEDDDQQ